MLCVVSIRSMKILIHKYNINIIIQSSNRIIKCHDPSYSLLITNYSLLKYYLLETVKTTKPLK